jgi:MurNAc alpha-1-phosphate uridylyltransferase
MKAVILAAGKGERMRPLTLVKPKPLLEVCGTTLIEHHIINLKNSGITEIIINVSWLAQQIMHKLGNGNNYGVKIKYSNEGSEPLETGGGLYNALDLIGKEPFLVVNADIKTDFDFSTITSEKLLNKLAHLVLVNNPKHNLLGDFTINNKSTLSYNDNQSKFTYSGIGIYNPNLFEGCEHGIYSVVPLLKHAMNQNKITGQLYQGQWDDIGNIDRLIEINKNCN